MIVIEPVDGFTFGVNGIHYDTKEFSKMLSYQGYDGSAVEQHIYDCADPLPTLWMCHIPEEVLEEALGASRIYSPPSEGVS